MNLVTLLVLGTALATSAEACLLERVSPLKAWRDVIPMSEKGDQRSARDGDYQFQLKKVSKTHAWIEMTSKDRGVHASVDLSGDTVRWDVDKTLSYILTCDSPGELGKD